MKEATSKGVIKGITEGYKANSISICGQHYIFNERRGRESTNYNSATKQFPFYKWIGCQLEQIHGLLEQQAKKERQKPKWTKEFKWKWVKDGELVKLLAVPLG